MAEQQGDEAVVQAWRAHRPYLVDLAFRMLGDIGAAEDVVQDAFSRLLRTSPGEIDDARGWLIVVTSRLCLDQIRSARARRERPHDAAEIEFVPGDPAAAARRESGDPADRVTLDDNVRLALLVVLQRLGPAERVVFVLHDIFAVPFDSIAQTVGRSAASCRQLARRARQKIEDSQGGVSFDVAAAEGESPYFCVFEADFDDAAALSAARASPEGQAVRADVPNYATGGAVVLDYELRAG